MNETPIIKIKNLDVVYFLGRSNETKALSDINLEIYPGEFIIFFGPSGCGKSTLLYSISGLETQIQGDIIIGEDNLAQMNERKIEQLHQKKIGMIFQAYYLITSLSVKQNVMLPQIAIGEDKRERSKRAIELLNHFGVGGQASKLPNELSGGQQQRVAICRSLINKPDILLADEPTGNLDSNSAEEVMKLLKDLNEKQKKTIILVTHNPARLDYAHRIFYMKDGTIIDVKINEAINRHLELEQSTKDKQSMSKDLELLTRSFSKISAQGSGNMLLPFKAKQIISEVMVGFTQEELDEVEKKIENFLLTGLADKEGMVRYLDESVEKGGFGMDKRRAEAVAEKIINLVNEIKIIEEEERKIMARKVPDSSGEILEIRRYLADTYKLKIIDNNTLNVFDKAIKDRLENKIDRNTFLKRLDIRIEEGGVGLDKRIAKKVARRMELLMLGKFK